MLNEPVSYSIAESDTVRLVQVTDPHLFADLEAQLLGVTTYQSFSAVLAMINQANHGQHLLLATGDLSQDYSPESYQLFANTVKRVPVPCHYLPGNHDDARLMNLSVQGDHVFGQQRIVIGKWQILMLDSTLIGKPGGYLGQRQFELIEQAIAQAPDKHVLLAMHHNPVLVGSTWLDQHCMANGEDLIEFAGQFKQIKGLVWGHVHQALDRQVPGRFGPLQLMATPSTCIQFKPQSANFALDGLQPGYRLLDLASDGSIHTQVYRLEGDDFSADNHANGY
ncbi:3',5'-cyclic-AMP phosphodiesterase [Shewanella sp.]|uniref:3',5'-cyclic-AMP phosphodiesterase n=1 Tax=Shewanella sp. TaxID=50422 RepID=UPI0040539DD5